MTPFVTKLLGGVIAVCLCCAAALAGDLSMVGQWAGQYPSDAIVNGQPLWDQPGVQEAMHAAMGKYYFSPLKKDRNAPEAPVVADGKGLFAAWICTNGDDCGGNNLTVYFDSGSGRAQACLRSEGSDGKVHDLWLADSEARPLPINGCGIGERHPFASLKKFGGK